MWNLSSPTTIEPTTPILEGGFLKTGPQENPKTSIFIGVFKA